MVVSMAAFAAEDAFVKAAAAAVPVGKILIALGLGGMLFFVCCAKLNKDRLLGPDALSSALFYVLTISLTLLSTTTVILQATP